MVRRDHITSNRYTRKNSVGTMRFGEHRVNWNTITNNVYTIYSNNSLKSNEKKHLYSVIYTLVQQMGRSHTSTAYNDKMRELSELITRAKNGRLIRRGPHSTPSKKLFKNWGKPKPKP